jgi:hypothetical protein
MHPPSSLPVPLTIHTFYIPLTKLVSEGLIAISGTGPGPGKRIGPDHTYELRAD